MTTPDHLRPFVLPTEPAELVNAGDHDLALPGGASAPAPVVVLVHGGPVRVAPTVSPRYWPVFRGYAAALAARGVAAVLFEHVVLRSFDYATAESQVSAVVAAVRARRDVDGDRVGLWFFSGGGPLAAPFLREPPRWLRVVALSYPLLRAPGPTQGYVTQGYVPVAELRAGATPPLVVVRAELEHPDLLAGQDEFVRTARDLDVELTVVDVPGGHHAFDTNDDTDGSRRAVVESLDHVVAHLG